MDIIRVSGIQTWSRHGLHPEELAMGGNFTVDLVLKGDLKKAAESDDIADTFDYAFANRVVQEEMDQPSKLLEHVAGRILDRLKTELKGLKEIVVSVTKHHPPMPGQIDAVSVTLSDWGETKANKKRVGY